MYRDTYCTTRFLHDPSSLWSFTSLVALWSSCPTSGFALKTPQGTFNCWGADLLIKYWATTPAMYIRTASWTIVLMKFIFFQASGPSSNCCLFRQFQASSWPPDSKLDVLQAACTPSSLQRLRSALQTPSDTVLNTRTQLPLQLHLPLFISCTAEMFCMSHLRLWCQKDFTL